MKKMKLYRETSNRIAALVLAGVFTATSFTMTGCSKNEDKTLDTSIVIVDDEQNNYNITNDEIKDLFPTLNDDLIKNTSLIMLLDEIAKEDENGKINADEISKYKAKIDVDNMMNDFNAFLNILEQSMIEEEKLISINSIVLESDEEILSKIEKITSNIINGNKEDIKTNFDLITKLFVNEKEITFDELTFSIRDLSYSGREVASAYARTAAYFAKEYITDKEYENLDRRTNDQNSKPYIKTKLEILSNDMDEKSLIEVNSIFSKEYKISKNTINDKINMDANSIEVLVNYLNIEYLNSDKISNKDKKSILGEYSDEEVSDAILNVSAITEYNAQNTNDVILLSNMLIDSYKETEKGKVDKAVLDYIQFNSVMLLNTTDENTTSKELMNNPYFKNMYKYFTRQDFTQKYSKENEVNVTYQNISDGTKLISDMVVYYTLNKRNNIFEVEGYETEINANLTYSIQGLQNIILGECKKIDINEYIKK